MKRVAVVQSNYLPWKGYFDIINDAELFIFHDDLQYTKNDWRNRNRIKTRRGPKWITVPVGTDEKRLICDVEINDKTWAARHWRKIEASYRNAPFFRLHRDFFEEVYMEKTWKSLSGLNQYLITEISRRFLGIRTAFADSRGFVPEGKKLERLLDLLKKAQADVYITGPAARDYIRESEFDDAGITLIFKDYSGYPEYPQFFPPFVHEVSIIDLLFHTGSDAPYYIWGWRDGRHPRTERG